MIRFSLVAMGILVAALVLTGPVAGAPKVIKGSVGPGFTISLASGGKKVTSLKAGVPYKFQISDKSSSHDFHLSGPGVNKVITSVSFMGMKSVYAEAQARHVSLRLRSALEHHERQLPSQLVMEGRWLGAAAPLYFA